MDYGKETLTLFEIDQPLCPLVYSEAPCTASLGTTGNKKCFNTRATCQDKANYRVVAGSPDVDNFLTLRFSRNQQGLMAYGPLIPSLEDVTTTPGSLNLAAMDRDSDAMGNREVLTLVFNDHKHSDNLVDPYRLERNIETGSPNIGTYDPYESGTFWGKWLARNPFKSAYRCRIYEGFVGDAVADMRVRNYVIDSVDGPNDGQVTITCIDLFTLIDREKAVAPVASLGELDANITDVATSATLTPAGIGNLEYAAAGILAIGDELMDFTRSSDALTLTRGQYNTTAEAHEQEDLVQTVLEYDAQAVVDVVHDLLLNFTTLTTDELPKTDWDIEAADLPEVYTARIATSVPVIDLVGELAEQAGFTLWPDVATGTIKFSALRAKANLATVTDNEWIKDESLNIIDQADRRASQVWVYYSQINATLDLDRKQNFRSRVVTPDLNAEGEFEYGVPAIKEIFSRWIPQFGRTLATDTGERLLNMFRDPPKEAEFQMHIGRNSAFGLADFISLETSEIQDDTGSVLPVSMAVVEKRIDENEISIRAEQVTFAEITSTGERTIYIENDINNINLRTIHDSLFTAPLGGSPGEIVRFIVVEGVTVGSDSSTLKALSTGLWPEGVALLLDVGSETGSARVQGGGGAGSRGGESIGTVGVAGGIAIFAEATIQINNLFGEIFSGGGGGGSAGGVRSPAVPSYYFSGGGGGGGAGTNSGAGGFGPKSFLPNINYFGNSSNGISGTADAGGVGVITDHSPYLPNTLGAGGTGGGPGLAGATGATGSAPGWTPQAGGAGGAAGDYISGDSFVTWTNNGDRRGGVS